MIPVHLVGSVGLDTAEEVFSTAGRLLGKHLKRCPDGEVGGRRLWVSWQYPLLRANPYLVADPARLIEGVGFYSLKIAPGIAADDIHFGELGYTREARTSYQDFLAARARGDLDKSTKFQVSLPTPNGVIAPFVIPEDQAAVEAAYEAAMLTEIDRLCQAIPHRDLSLQWDVCIEMVTWDGNFAPWPRFAGIEKAYAKKFGRICMSVPADVDLGFHLCYGDLDAKHFVEPKDMGRLVEFANLLTENVGHKIAYVHMPVPIGRADKLYFAPLKELKTGPDTEIYLGLVHEADGSTGAQRRMTAARSALKTFGIATECGMARSRTVQHVRRLLEIHAQVVHAEPPA